MTYPAHVPDDLDIAILRALESDGRATITSLAEQLEITRTTVKARFEAMRRQDVFRVVGLVDPGYLGRPVVVVFMIKFDGDPAEVLQIVWDMAAISWACSMTDSTTLVAQGSFATLASVAEFVDTRLRAETAIVDIEPHILTAVFNPSRSRGSSDAVAWFQATPRPLDPIDLRIARALQEDGRAPFARLADLTGLSVAAARQRGLKLMDAGVVQIRTIIDPSVLGLRGVGLLCVTVDGDSAGVARRIAAMDDVNYVDQTLGRYPVLAEFHCPDHATLIRRRRAVQRLDEVRGAELLLMGATPTYGGSWV